MVQSYKNYIKVGLTLITRLLQFFRFFPEKTTHSFISNIKAILSFRTDRGSSNVTSCCLLSSFVLPLRYSCSRFGGRGNPPNYGPFPRTKVVTDKKSFSSNFQKQHGWALPVTTVRNHGCCLMAWPLMVNT